MKPPPKQAKSVLMVESVTLASLFQIGGASDHFVTL